MITETQRARISQLLADSRQKLDNYKAALRPPRSVFDAQIAERVAARRQATPAHVRISDNELRQAALTDVQQGAVAAMREARSATAAQLETLRPLLATIAREARRRSMPMQFGSEIDQVRQELKAARLQQRFAGRPTAAKLAALQAAEERGDTFDAAVLDEMIADDFADVPPMSPSVIAAQRDNQRRQEAHSRRELFTRYEAIQTTRVSDVERQFLETWAKEIDGLEAAYGQTGRLAAAVEHVGAVTPIAEAVPA